MTVGGRQAAVTAALEGLYVDGRRAVHILGFAGYAPGARWGKNWHSARQFVRVNDVRTGSEADIG